MLKHQIKKEKNLLVCDMMSISNKIIGNIIGKDRCSRNKEQKCKICGAYGDEHSIVDDVCSNCYMNMHGI